MIPKKKSSRVKLDVINNDSYWCTKLIPSKYVVTNEHTKLPGNNRITT